MVALSDRTLLRHARSIALPSYGAHGLIEVARKKVILVGLGGLGGLIAELLVRSDVGSLEIWEHDRVDETNLPRQLLYTESDVGEYKAVAAEKRLTALGNTRLTLHNARWTPESVHEHSETAELVIAATDNMHTRYDLQRLARKQGAAFMSCAVTARDGQIFVCSPVSDERACFACLFPPERNTAGEEVRDNDEQPACVTQGVLAPLAAVVASSSAVLALDWLARTTAAEGWQESLKVVDGWNMSMRGMTVPRDEACSLCGPP